MYPFVRTSSCGRRHQQETIDTNNNEYFHDLLMEDYVDSSTYTTNHTLPSIPSTSDDKDLNIEESIEEMEDCPDLFDLDDHPRIFGR